MPGRSTEAEFPNRTATDRHEYWAPRSATLIMSAAFAGATDEYGHGVLGNLSDAKGLTIHLRRPGSNKISCPAEAALPVGQVFEDIAPRLADLNGDGMPEIIVVQSGARSGARLAIYNRRAELVAATPYIGTRFRWLAPAGIGDMDQDGAVELAYVDRPHLAKTLRVWRFENGQLTEIATLGGVSNHRIGDEVIWGGMRNCAGTPQMVLADGGFRRIVLVELNRNRLQLRDTTLRPTPGNFSKVLACKE
ncbi:MAG: VCBS repeat-containing protein [Pseudomonadota bacterium]